MSEPSDDHALAGWLATVAGERLLAVRGEGLEGRALKDEGDRVSHELLMELLATHRPDDAVLSEEGKDDAVRLTASRVWIVDPLDGTREFSEPPRDDWAVHVALWQDGDLAAGRSRSRVWPPLTTPRTRPPCHPVRRTGRGSRSAGLVHRGSSRAWLTGSTRSWWRWGPRAPR